MTDFRAVIKTKDGDNRRRKVAVGQWIVNVGLQGSKDRQENFITMVRTKESGNRTRRLTIG